jgi:aspartyl/glutamyl-tRNA(Asn/Gln) amidotransferase C subunit
MRTQLWHAAKQSVTTATRQARPLGNSGLQRCTHISQASAEGAGVEPPNVQRLAQLAQLGVTEAEAAEWGPKISSIVEWFGQLQQVDLDGVPPALRADVEDSNLLRPDEPKEFSAR